MDADGPSLPADFLERLERILPAERLGGVLESFAAPRRPAFRINTLKATLGSVLAELEEAGLVAEPLTWHEGAFTLAPGELERLQGTGAFRRGEVWVQNPSSMLPPLWLAPQPGERVLDLCAAPGSKTTQLACLMGDEGEIVANDRSRRRCFKLERVLAEQGVSSAEVSNRSGEVFGRVRAGSFDRVLVDAPCSGEGRFSTEDPDSWSDWRVKKIKRLASQQRRLLISGLYALRPGGVLVYSTCTFAPEENEGVVDKVLRHFEGSVVLGEPTVELPEMIPGRGEWRGRPYRSPDLGRTRRVLPDGTLEGFFLARLERPS